MTRELWTRFFCFTALVGLLLATGFVNTIAGVS